MTGLRVIIIHSLRRPRFSMTWVLAQVAGGRRAVGELRRRRIAVLPDAFDLGVEAVDALAEQVDDLLLQAPGDLRPCWARPRSPTPPRPVGTWSARPPASRCPAGPSLSQCAGGAPGRNRSPRAALSHEPRSRSRRRSCQVAGYSVSSAAAARRPLRIAPSMSAANSPPACSPAKASGPTGRSNAAPISAGGEVE